MSETRSGAAAAGALRVALAPTRWLLLGLGLMLAWRFAGLLARQAFELMDVAPRELLKGVLWDLSLGCAVFALARTGRLLALVAPRAALAGRAALGASCALGALSALVRGIDTAHCYLGQSHWTAQAFMYLDRGFVGTLAEPRTLAVIGVMLGSAALVVLAIARDSARVTLQLRPTLPSLSPRRRALTAWAALLLTALPAFWALKDGVRYPAHVHHLRLIPEVNLVLQWVRARELPDRTGDQAALKLSEATWSSLQRAALVPAGSRPDAPFPLLRTALGEPPFPYPRREGVAADAAPNVVLTFMESVNSLFVHEISGRYRGLMPELGRLSRQMTRVQGFHNTAAPTIVAMVAALCSVHPASHPYDLDVGQSVDGRTAYTCLADVLRRHGYRTVYVQGASRKITSKEYFFRTHGFDEVYGREDIRELWPDRPQGPWGFYDRDSVAFAERQLERLEALRRQDGRPFLLVTLTLDPHEPGMGPPEALPTFRADLRQPGIEDVPDEEAAHLQLASYHSSDAAIGRWGRFVLQPERAKHTLFMLTADHAMFRNLVTNTIFHDRTRNRSFDHVPMLIHDPLHALPPRLDVLAGTTDISPSILHLLGIDRVMTSFTGLSLFGRRREVPVLVGRVGLRFVYLHSGTADADLPAGVVRERCQRGERLLEDGSDPLSACEVAAWLDWSDALWATRRLFPESAYFGDQGVDKAGLALQMYENKKEQRLKKELGHDKVQNLRKQALERALR